LFRIANHATLGCVCATLIVCLPAEIAMAQSTLNADAPPSSATSDTDKAVKDTDAPTRNADAPKKKKAAKMTRQQEIDKSVDRGTVPARYRNSVPKQYQQYVPFDKR
jgi:hypothetical protein